MIRALLVEDEAPARAKLRRLLSADRRFELVGEARNGFEALARIEDLQPDVVFLDVQIPGPDGFEVLDALGSARDFVVVFSTAHDEHALRAFNAHAIDYLLKPYDGGRFQAALDKACRQLAGMQQGNPPARPMYREPRRLVARAEDGWIAVELHRIMRASASDKRVELFTDEGRICIRGSLRSLAQRLDPERFLRVHRGEIVRVDAVLRYEPNGHGDGILTLSDDSAVPLSRTHREAFLARFRASSSRDSDREV
jgi:two-component system LytT family response regulator